MSVLLFSATAPGAPVPLEVASLGAQLRATGVVTLVVPAVAHIPDASFAKLCRRVFWSDLQAVVVVAPDHVRDGALLAERIKHIRFLFPSQVKVWVSGLPGIPLEVQAQASGEPVAFDSLLGALKALHGQLEGGDSAGGRLPLTLWPKNHERTKAAELMLQASPCSGRCVECPHFEACDWGRVPTWETFSERDKQAFAQELKVAVVRDKVRAFYLRDFGLDGSLDKARWLRGLIAELPAKVMFVADMQLDHWVRQPEVLDTLMSAGLVGVNLEVGSLHAGSRRARGGLPRDARQLLSEFRKAASTELLIHARLSAGLPGDTLDRLMADAQWLLSPEGRAAVDSFSFRVQEVFPRSILGRCGGYQFDAMGAWALPGISRSQAEQLVARIEGLVKRLNFIHARWPTADAYLQAVSMGVGFPAVRDFLRSAWGCSEANKTKTTEVLDRLEGIVASSFSEQMLLGSVLE